jgi:CAAX prenyl protease-like protein
LQRHPSLPYVLPFVVFLLLLTFQRWVLLPPAVDYPLRCVVLAAVLYFCSRHVIDFRMVSPIPSLCLGVLVFLIWIGPDILFPGYRQHWLFQNSITGTVSSSMTQDARMDIGALVFRTIRAVVLVPIIEELFWRAWLMRWLITPKFETLKLGTWSTQAFWFVAVLFASEHGPFWDVGLIAGVLYNWWMVRTRSLGDCIFAHAVTNACLSAYVIVTQRWEYWL